MNYNEKKEEDKNNPNDFPKKYFSSQEISIK